MLHLYTLVLHVEYLIRIMLFRFYFSFQKCTDLQVLNGSSLAIENAICLGKLVETLFFTAEYDFHYLPFKDLKISLLAMLINHDACIFHIEASSFRYFIIKSNAGYIFDRFKKMFPPKALLQYL